MNATFMTLEAFKAKWGTCGEYPSGKWRVSETVNHIVVDGSHCLSLHESQYTGWDAYLTAVGCKPVDPRDTVFKSYGWTFQPESKQEFAKWFYTKDGQQWIVFAESGIVHKIGRGIYENMAVITAQQAEGLCAVMGLSKVKS